MNHDARTAHPEDPAGAREGTIPGAPVGPNATQHAIQIVGAGTLRHTSDKPVPAVRPHSVLARVEAVGICFSDTKLLHQFTAHPRKSGVLGGIEPSVLEEITSYVPGDAPTVPGHEVVCRIVAIGRDVRRHRVGERCLVQTDYRHLPTVSANAAFGYNFEGGLQEFVLLDERVIIEPETGERFLIPVGDDLSASAVALVEPWACVESSYAFGERRGPLPGGRLLVVAEDGSGPSGLPPLIRATRPAEITAWAASEAARDAIASASSPAPIRFAELVDDLPKESFDDLVYFGASAARLSAIQDLVAARGLVNVVTGGASLDGPVPVDVGRVHYDLIRWVGTHSSDPSDGYASIPADGELRAGDRVAVIGAAGPMGLMHVARAITLGVPDLTILGVDIDDPRLEHLAATAGPLARERGVALEVANSRHTPLEPGFSYVAVLAPAPFLVADAVRLAGTGCRINIFAGFALHTRSDIDLDRYIERRCYFLGTSGSRIPDMHAVLERLELGSLDTNISLDAVTGMAGVGDALEAVEQRTLNGKIVVYPSLHDLGLTRLSDLGTRFPGVGRDLEDGRWTKAAEDELLAEAADRG